MVATPAKFMDKLLRPKSRWAYALWTILAFNFLSDSHKNPDWTTVEFWLFRSMAVFFFLAWFAATLSRLREFRWSLWWVIVFTLPWIGLIWTFWWNPGRIGIAVFALWFALQSVLILKDGRPAPDTQEAEAKT